MGAGESAAPVKSMVDVEAPPPLDAVIHEEVPVERVLVKDPVTRSWVDVDASAGLVIRLLSDRSEMRYFLAVSRPDDDDHPYAVATPLSRTTRYNTTAPTLHDWNLGETQYAVKFKSEGEAATIATATCDALSMVSLDFSGMMANGDGSAGTGGLSGIAETAEEAEPLPITALERLRREKRAVSLVSTDRPTLNEIIYVERGDTRYVKGGTVTNLLVCPNQALVSALKLG